MALSVIACGGSDSGADSLTPGTGAAGTIGTGGKSGGTSTGGTSSGGKAAGGASAGFGGSTTAGAAGFTAGSAGNATAGSAGSAMTGGNAGTSGATSGGAGGSSAGAGGAVAGAGGSTSGAGGTAAGAGGSTSGAGGTAAGAGGSTSGAGGTAAGAGGSDAGAGGASAGAAGTAGGAAGDAGAGGSTAGAAGAGGSTQVCTPVSAGAIKFIAGATGTAGKYRGNLTPALGGADPDDITFFFDSDAAGNISLTTAPNDNYKTCSQCVLGIEDRTFAGAGKFFFQTAGAMEINASSEPTSGKLDVTLTGVVLSEVTIAADNTSTLVPGGKCLTLANTSVSITTGIGSSCTNAEACGDATRICDVATSTCQPAQCSAGKACPTQQTCVAQTSGATEGACYPLCTMFQSGQCGGTGECVPLGEGSNFGYCEKKGTSPLNGACEGTDVGTGCTSGVCVNDGQATPVCRASCNPFAANPGCGAGQHCNLEYFCNTAVVNAAAPGAPCGAGSNPGDYCDNGSGLCEPPAMGQPLLCYRACRTAGSDCTGGKTCVAAFSSLPDLGVCN